MEKKTMGSFLAALRRASGMTQKELAERLNVSDKSVSRWERADGAHHRRARAAARRLGAAEIGRGGVKFSHGERQSRSVGWHSL